MFLISYFWAVATSFVGIKSVSCGCKGMSIGQFTRVWVKTICKRHGASRLLETAALFKYISWQEISASKTPGRGLSELGLQHFVEQLAPYLTCVRSRDAGCGKTEVIRQRAFARKKLPVTVPLSGPLKMVDLIKRLLGQEWQRFHCLHLDIGPTEDVDFLDDILVQMSFWGCIQADSMIAMIPHEYTFIELANLSSPILCGLAVLRFSDLVPGSIEANQT